MSYFSVKNLSVSFADFKLEKVSLTIDKGNLLVILGPSGCGKTTLIHALAGITSSESGKIFIGDRDISNEPTNKRNIGIVFQDGALFPHMNVFDNIAFGLKVKKKKKEDIINRVNSLLELIDLKNYGKRKIYNLSGGEKQRVALARTLAPSPDIIFFDEPFSALDENLRIRLREELKKIQRQIGFTGIYVTHDREEAFYLADYIAVMYNGKILQIDKPENLYTYPKNNKVASFMGVNNSIPVTVESMENGLVIVILNNKRLKITNNVFTQKLLKGQKVFLVIKPEVDLTFDQNDCANKCKIIIKSVNHYSNFIELNAEMETYDIKLRVFNNRNYSDSFHAGNLLNVNLPFNSFHLVTE